MPTTRFAAGLLALFELALLCCPASAAEEPAAQEGPVYELRTYTAAEGRLNDLHARFRQHTLRLFAKHGMRNVMYWTPTDKKLAGNTLVYLLEHASPAAAEASWKAFRADPDWLKIKADSEQNGPLVSKVESLYLKPTDFSPAQN